MAMSRTGQDRRATGRQRTARLGSTHRPASAGRQSGRGVVRRCTASHGGEGQGFTHRALYGAGGSEARRLVERQVSVGPRQSLARHCPEGLGTERRGCTHSASRCAEVRLSVAFAPAVHDADGTGSKELGAAGTGSARRGLATSQPFGAEAFGPQWPGTERNGFAMPGVAPRGPANNTGLRP